MVSPLIIGIQGRRSAQLSNLHNSRVGRDTSYDVIASATRASLRVGFLGS